MPVLPNWMPIWKAKYWLWKVVREFCEMDETPLEG